MLTLMMNKQPNNVQSLAKHSDLAPSVSNSSNEVYANDEADNNATTEYLVR